METNGIKSRSLRERELWAGVGCDTVAAQTKEAGGEWIRQEERRLPE